MTIKGLNAFLRKKCPAAFIHLPNGYFHKKRIAIDSDNILRRLMSRAHKEVVDKTDVAVMEPDRDEIIKRWLGHMKGFVMELLRIGATPIFVFDGKYINEKSGTQEKRREEKKKRIDEAEEMKRKLLELDVLERTPQMITELRKKMHHLGFLSKEEKEMAMGILSGLGIPVLTAKGEGEQLCAMLCIEGKVDAVYSRDSDMVAFGCPLTITEPAGYVLNPRTEMVEESFSCVVFKPILSALNMSYETFRDLCIMSGCDFNSNIPHLGVGKSYNILMECKSIDKIPEKYHIKSTCVRHAGCKYVSENYEDQTECLNHIRCREIMGHFPSEEICQDKIVVDIQTNLTEARDILENYGVDDWISDFVDLYRTLPKPSEVFIRKYPSLSSSRLRLVISGAETQGKNQGKNQGKVDELELLTIKPTQQPSPKRITNKHVNKLSKYQHKKMLKKYQHLKLG